MQLKTLANQQLQDQLQDLQSALNKPRETNAAILWALQYTDSRTQQEHIAKKLLAAAQKKWLETENLSAVFWVLCALYTYDRKLVEGKRLAYGLKRLIASELQAGGPYGTKDHIDPIINALIYNFLKQQAVLLPNVEKYLAKAIHRGGKHKNTSAWLNLVYLAAPVLTPKDQQHILRKLQNILPKDLLSAQDTALHISTVIKLDPTYSVDRYIKQLLQQVTNSQTIASNFCFSSEIQHKDIGLAKAQTIEALSLYIGNITEKSTTSANQALREQILQATKNQLISLPAPLNKTGEKMWEKMRAADKNHEIVLLPQFFAETIINCPDKLVLECARLGAANFYCWIATIIYDDFIDEEGEPALLPLANIAHRLSLQLYRQSLVHSPDLYAEVEELYKTVDQANAWEVTHTRATVTKSTITIDKLPSYGPRSVLADRALGHVIGPIIIAQQLPNVKPIQAKQIEEAMRNYLIARQLNDDLHDWRKDLKAGQISSVVVDLLKGIKVREGTHEFKLLVPEMEAYFLEKGLHTTCTKLLSHVQRSRQALAASQIISTTGGFITLLDNLELSAQDALLTAKNRRAFLKAFSSK